MLAVLPNCAGQHCGSSATPPAEGDSAVHRPQATPEDIVLSIATRLNVADSTLTTAAVWLVSSRIQLDVTPHRFFVKLRLIGS